MFKIIYFLCFAQKVSSGMGALRPKFFRGIAELEHPQGPRLGAKEVQIFFFSLFIFIIYSFSLIHNYFPIYLVCEEC